MAARALDSGVGALERGENARCVANKLPYYLNFAQSDTVIVTVIVNVGLCVLFE